jgi:hypothetical protein
MRRWVAAIALAATVVIGMPAVAHADEAECEGTYFATAGRELFEPERRYIPPPLRDQGWDCASRIAGDSGATIESAYQLVWVDIPWDRFVAIVRSFEQSEWVADGRGLITAYDFAAR